MTGKLDDVLGLSFSLVWRNFITCHYYRYQLRRRRQHRCRTAPAVPSAGERSPQFRQFKRVECIHIPLRIYTLVTVSVISGKPIVKGISTGCPFRVIICRFKVARPLIAAFPPIFFSAAVLLVF